MTEIKNYICDMCLAPYLDAEDAKKCEKSHALPVEIENMQYAESRKSPSWEVDNMQLGDRVRRMPTMFEAKTGGDLRGAPAPQPGTVTYIHPRGRFYVVRFDCGFCEAYPFKEVDQDGEA